MSLIGKYVWNILVSLDQLGNTLTFGAPDETISSRLGRKYRGTWLEKTVDWCAYILTGKKNHCEDALEPDSHHADEIAKNDTGNKDTLLS